MIKQQLTEDMKVYMKAKDKLKLSGIKMAIAAIKNKEIETKRELTDEEIIAILKKQVKEHQESLSFLKEGDTARDEYKAYIDSISKFIPKDMSKEEATDIITKALAEANITEKKQKGLAMKTIMPILKSKLDGKVIQEIVDSILV